MLNTIVDAIRNRHVLAFEYDGIERTVEPHAVGVSKDGNDVMRGFQTNGEHVAQGQEWMLCELSKITKLVDTGTSFTGTRPDYKKGDTAMKRSYIFAEL